jgi:hypothetical protein
VKGKEPSAESDTVSVFGPVAYRQAFPVVSGSPSPLEGGHSP